MYPPAIRRPRDRIMGWGTRVAAALFFILVDSFASPAFAALLFRSACIDSAAVWAAIAPFRAIRSGYLFLTGCRQDNSNRPAICA